MNIEKLKELKRLLALFWNREHHGCPSEIVRCFEILDSLIAAAEQKPEMPKHKPDCSYEKSKGKDPIMPCTCDYTTRLEEYCQKPVCKTCGGCSGKVSTSATACDDCSPDRQNHTGESTDMIKPEPNGMGTYQQI